MLNRLLKPDESIKNGLSAKDPLSNTTIIQHVTNRSNNTLKSKFISTCGSLQTVLAFAENKPNPRIAKIWEKNLPVVKIDLRTQENRNNYYADEHEEFHAFANTCEEVLFVGYVPETHVELLTGSDFANGQMPLILNF